MEHVYYNRFLSNPNNGERGEALLAAQPGHTWLVHSLEFSAFGLQQPDPSLSVFKAMGSGPVIHFL
jgi:hypothetical protein